MPFSFPSEYPSAGWTCRCLRLAPPSNHGKCYQSYVFRRTECAHRTDKWEHNIFVIRFHAHVLRQALRRSSGSGMSGHPPSGRVRVGIDSRAWALKLRHRVRMRHRYLRRRVRGGLNWVGTCRLRRTRCSGVASVLVVYCENLLPPCQVHLQPQCPCLLIGLIHTSMNASRTTGKYLPSCSDRLYIYRTRSAQRTQSAPPERRRSTVASGPFAETRLTPVLEGQVSLLGAAQWPRCIASVPHRAIPEDDTHCSALGAG